MVDRLRDRCLHSSGEREISAEAGNFRSDVRTEKVRGFKTKSAVANELQEERLPARFDRGANIG